MLKLAKVLILLSLISSGYFCLRQKRIDEVYNDINNFLENEIKSNDVKSNMRAAVELLSSEVKKDPNQNRPLILALRCFTSLTLLEGSARCTRIGHAILMRNDQATNGVVHKMGSKLRRIDIIVYEYAHKHAKDCQAIYPDAYRAKMRQLDESRVKQVETYVDEVIKSTQVNRIIEMGNEKLWLDYVSKSKRQANRAIKALSMADSNYDYLKSRQASEEVRREKLESLFVKYLIKPCEYYVRELGPDVFVPARFDWLLYREINEQRLDYYFGWARFRFCSVLINRDYKLLLDNVINEADES